MNHCKSVWVEVDRSFLNNEKNLILGCIYRSPSSSLCDFLRHLSKVLSELTFENKNVVIVGDVNINLLDTYSTSYANYTDCFSGLGFESLVDCPTRVAPHGTGTLIDHVLSNMASPPCVGVVDTDITDHFPIFLTFKNITHKRNISYSTSVFSSDSFVEAISTTDWVPVMSMCDPDAALRAFCSSFLLSVSTNTRTVQCKKKYKYPHNPWMTNGLLISLRKKENMYKKGSISPLICAWLNDTSPTAIY